MISNRELVIARTILHKLDIIGFDEFSDECTEYLIRVIEREKNKSYEEGRKSHSLSTRLKRVIEVLRHITGRKERNEKTIL